jgi:HSP20 family protein
MESEYQMHVSFPVNVKAGKDSFEIKAFLPGVLPEDIDIQIVNEVVTISGELQVDRDPESDYLLTELPSGKFHRVISLPTTLDADNVEAVMDGGMLTLSIPKAETARPKTIKINKK